jgi:hypothetical protein
MGDGNSGKVTLDLEMELIFSIWLPALKSHAET